MRNVGWGKDGWMDGWIAVREGAMRDESGREMNRL